MRGMPVEMTIEKFTVNVPEAVLDDLQRRLDAMRWPDELHEVGWDIGTNLAYMKSLAAYWRNTYDWRLQEAALNRLPQYRIAVDGFHVHLVRAHGNASHVQRFPVESEALTAMSSGHRAKISV